MNLQRKRRCGVSWKTSHILVLKRIQRYGSPPWVEGWSLQVKNGVSCRVWNGFQGKVDGKSIDNDLLGSRGDVEDRIYPAI